MELGNYLLIRRFDDKLDRIERKVDLLISAGTEVAVLRQEITRLLAEADMAQAAKDALAAKIDSVFAKSEATEAKMRAAVPA